jgi:DNA-binding response OmpR family regulator
MTIKILLVEDTPDLAENIADILSMEGFNVTIANNGKQGLDLAMTTTPDLIISDVVMPQMSGFELVLKLRSDEKFKHLPIILLSAKYTKDDIEDGLKSGANMYLKKPCDTDFLIDCINKLFNEKRESK